MKAFYKGKEYRVVYHEDLGVIQPPPAAESPKAISPPEPVQPPKATKPIKKKQTTTRATVSPVHGRPIGKARKQKRDKPLKVPPEAVSRNGAYHMPTRYRHRKVFNWAASVGR